MKIAYVVKRYPRFSETFIVNEILAHERAGVEIEIFALLPSEDSHFQDLLSEVRAPVTFLPRKVWKASDFWDRVQAAAAGATKGYASLCDAQGMALRDVAQGFELSRLVRDRGVTHLHAHFASASTSVARLAAQLAGITYSFTAHAKDIFHEDVDRAELRRKFKAAAASITVSDYNFDVLNAEFGRDADGLRRIYNGLDLKKFPYAAARPPSNTILAVGRLVEKKGFADLIDACAILRGRGIGFDCQIVGTGEIEGVLREKLDSLELNDSVTLTGALPQRQVKSMLQRAAVFAAPCVVGEDGNRDGLPTVLLEAMAMGTPCVSTPVTGIPEILSHNDTGLLVNCADPNALAGAIEKLLRDRSLASQLARSARALIEQQFDIDINAHVMREMFREVAGLGESPMMEIAL